MSSSLPEIPKSLNLSKLAPKYGPYDHGPLKGTGKSGFTPVSPWVEGTAKSPRSWKIRKRIERWQTINFYGWTARELNSLEALAAFQEPLPNNLTNELHPLFQLNRWMRKEELPLHRSPYPLPPGHEGFWEAHNPTVWVVLEPCLRLASMFIDNFHIWSWWDTWLFGELTDIEDEPFQGTGKWLRRVHQREPETIFAGENALRAAFLALSENVLLGIADGETLPSDGLPMADLHNGWSGLTMFDNQLDRETVFLNCKMLSQLLIPDLTTAEIAVAQFHVATVMVHEIAHALWQLNPERNQETHGEPYFEDEGIAEGGNSLTNFIFNGQSIPLRPSNSMAGFWATTWPTTISFAGLGNPTIGILPSTSQIYSIPIEFFERISQKDFWDYYVPRLGPEAFHFSPLTYGCNLRYVQDRYQLLTVENTWKNLPQIHTEGSMSPGDVKSVEFENGRRGTADRVIKSLKKVRIQERAAEKAVLENLLGGPVEVSGAEWSQPGELLYLSPEPEEGPYRGPKRLPSDLNHLPEPARFQEIQSFFSDNREVLTLDTLFTPIPENTLLAYINRVGVITLNQEELREFLIYCVYGLDILFWDLRITRNNFASIRISGKGWPDRQVIPEREPLTPPDGYIDHLVSFMTENGFAQVTLTYHTRFLDFDSEVIRALYNRHRGMNDYRPIFNEDEWDLIMDYCTHCRRLWTRGPPGIVRLLPPPPDLITIYSPGVHSPSDDYPDYNSNDDSNNEPEEGEVVEGSEYESDQEVQQGGAEVSEEGETEEGNNASNSSDDGNAEGQADNSSDGGPSEFDMWADIQRHVQRIRNNQDSSDDEDD